jgi:pimeloyl-ACP methyl ester carboxylesterase
VRVWSQGDGPVLLYLHGFERHPGAASFLQELARERQVVAPEHPGYGESTGFEALRDVIDVALYYRRFIEGLGAGPVDVMGHSLGGMFAAEVAALSPHLVRKLVLVDAYGLWCDEHPVPDPFALDPAEFDAARWSSNGPPEQEPAIAIPEADNPHAAAYDRARNLSVATKFLWPIPDRGLRRRLPFVEAPTLIVHGAEDGLVPPSYAQEFASLIPNASVEMMEGAGHYPMVDKQERFGEVVQTFLVENGKA